MLHSPLRYPGGKSDFFAVAKSIISNAGISNVHVIEPYAGSAAVSLGLLDWGIARRVTLLERDPLLYAFWFCVFNHPAELIVAFQELPITIKTWEETRPLLAMDKPDPKRLVDLAVAALFLNRANFSGILNAGPIGGRQQRSKYKIDCRTNKDEIISRLLALSMLAPNVEVQFGDAVEWINRNSKTNSFVYLDPPYFVKGALLYRYHYRLKDHRDLSRALTTAKFKWLLSYDDDPVIEYLYEEFHISRLAFQYSVHSPQQRSELLISNFGHSLPPEYVAVKRRMRGRPGSGIDAADLAR
ncbi:MAG: DNA adenine methylase [Rubrivivax sp.]|nr:DNA adenine methylase [Rubrivivax sp.]